MVLASGPVVLGTPHAHKDREGFAVEDHYHETREETDAFKEEHRVKPTARIFIEGKHIGGYDDLRKHFGKSVQKDGETSDQPVIAIFGVAFFLDLAIGWYVLDTVLTVQVIEWFASLSMVLLAIQKLQDIRSFSNMFLYYELLARRWFATVISTPSAILAASLARLSSTSKHELMCP